MSSPSTPTFGRNGVEVQKRYGVGVSLLLLVVILWTLSNFVTQDLYEDGYEKPFLVTYLNTSIFTLYLLPWAAKLFFSSTSKKPESAQGYVPVGNHEESTDGDTINLQPPTTAELEAEPLGDHLNRQLNFPLTIQETAKLASVFCFFWFIANWSINASLGFTSVASATILSSTSGFFTLAVGRILRIEALSFSKVCALCISFAGVVLISTSDSSASVTPLPEDVLETTTTLLPKNRIWGDILAILGAAFYALYVNLLKVRVQDENRLDMQLFFGFVGLFNILFLLPVGVTLHLTKLETIELPHSRRVWAALISNMLFTLSSDYVYVLAMLKTTPLLVTVGLSLTIPLALVGDYFLHKPSTFQAIFGAFWIILGFIIIGLEKSKVVATLNMEPIEEESSAA